MKKTTVFVCAALMILAGALAMPPAAQTQAPGPAQDVRGLLQAVSKNIGADTVNTIEYVGVGMVAAPGQGYDPIPVLIGIPESWPRFSVTNYSMTIDYGTMSSREAYTRTSPEPPKRYPGLDGPAAEHGNLSDPSFRRGGGGIANTAPVDIDLRSNRNVAWDVVNKKPVRQWQYLVGSSRVDLQACKLEYSIVSPK